MSIEAKVIRASVGRVLTDQEHIEQQRLKKLRGAAARARSRGRDVAIREQQATRRLR